MADKIIIASDVKKIEGILKKFTKGTKTDRKPLKPKLKIIFTYSQTGDKINGYLYAHDIDDGYFRDCFISDLDTGKKLDKKHAAKMIRNLISYCKKEDLDIFVDAGRYYGKSEFELYKKLGFKVDKKSKVMGYHL